MKQEHSTLNCKVSGTGTNCISTQSEIVLSTALVNLVSSSGMTLTCRALLDCGSQSNFITENVAQKLKLKKEKSNLHITGISQNSTNVCHKVTATVQSRNSDFSATSEYLVLPKITGYLPNCTLNSSTWNIPPNLNLADPSFASPGKIDLLIGQECFFDILVEGRIKQANMPIIQNTQLGWIFGGPANGHTGLIQRVCHLSMTERIDETLQKFWHIEEPTAKKILTNEERACDDHYSSTFSRGEDGRYTVKMPFKMDPEVLGTSRETAERRFSQIERRFKKQPELYEEYKSFLVDYKDLGHMDPTSLKTKEVLSEPEFFLPHHPIIKDTSTTTKLRVVFDASARTSTSLSLNDILMVGPTIQDDLFSIIIRFRLFVYVMTADIEKMYRQIWIDPSQRSLLKILWRNDPTDNMKTYHLNTVTYGTACAPYLAIRTLHQLAEDDKHKFPEASVILKRDFYVDDMLSGADTLDDALKLQRQIIDLLKSGGFNLRKWNANHPALLQHLPSDMKDNQQQIFPTEKGNTSKALGLLWDATRDELHFQNTIHTTSNSKISKRTILSNIAKLFDPLGVLAPTIVIAKLMLQRLWQDKFEWDEELPQEVTNDWLNFQSSLASLNGLRINRAVISENPGNTLEIHGFCDASEKAYGGTVYIRQVSENGHVTVTLLCAKSRVAPLKTISLPRLELCGALLLAELVAHVKQSWYGTFSQTYYWTDSTIVLAWLASEAACWKTFIANRVAKIQDLSKPEEWKHVASEENPADIVSRGMLITELSQSALWWNGPDWLSKPQDSWPSQHKQQVNDEVLERKRVTATAITQRTTKVFTDMILTKYSSLTRLQRVTAYCYRFIHNCKSKGDRLTGPLSSNELNNSLRTWVRIEQNNYFHEELTDLKNNGEVNKKCKILMLKPILDKDELIRVGGRLENADCPYEQKHPILISDKSYLTQLIIKHEHLRALHAGPQLLLSTVRQQFWPLNGRNLARKIVHQCVPCFKAKPKWSQPEMGNLPIHRVRPARAFINTGIDYCGPVLIRSNRLRRSTLIKGYIAVFVCFSTRAIHLELVMGLTTEAFLAAFKRFTSRRGICLNVYSDNGTNFIGANHELKELYRLLNSDDHRTKLNNSTSLLKLQWHFIPPKSPHFGGIWEAGVKSVKYHLRRVVGNTNMTFEELYTTLTLIEACLNSRPLTPLSSDPNDPSPLTPGHFLVGEALTSLPDQDYRDIASNRLSHWQRTQQIMQHFWHRWSKEYLSNLQQRHKWRKSVPDIKLGQVVVIREDNLPPLSWVTAVVTEVHPGTDGRTRVATVRTSTGLFKRAINRLCPLPINNDVP